MPRLPLAAFAVETIASAEVAQASAKIFFIVCPFSSALVVMRWHLKCLINAVLRNQMSRYTRIIYATCSTKRRRVKIYDIINVVYIEGVIVSERMSSYLPAAKGLEVFGMLNSIAIVLRLHQ